jgi:hypothetical protein
MSEAATKVIAGEISSQTGKDLGFAGETAERTSVEDAGAVARKGRSIRVLRLGKLPGNELSTAVHGDFGWKEKAHVSWFGHPQSLSLSGLVITQLEAEMHVMNDAGVCGEDSLNVLRITNVTGARCYKFLVRQDGQLSASRSTILPFLSGARALR